MTPIAKVIAELIHATNVEARSELLQRWFAGQAWFWRYSARNVAMICWARPDATHVLGLRAWKELGRRVKKRETPILLLAPTRYARTPFIAVPVFDITQTTGKPYVAPSVSLVGDSPVLQAVERAGRRLKIKVTEFRGRKGEYGRMLSRRHVQVARGLPAAERAATLIHEYAGQGGRVAHLNAKRCSSATCSVADATTMACTVARVSAMCMRVA